MTLPKCECRVSDYTLLLMHYLDGKKIGLMFIYVLFLPTHVVPILH